MSLTVLRLFRIGDVSGLPRLAFVQNHYPGKRSAERRSRQKIGYGKESAGGCMKTSNFRIESRRDGSELVERGRLKIAPVTPVLVRLFPNREIFDLSPGSPRTRVLGHFQPSLRDYSLALANPGLTSWATLSRPYGTRFGECGSHAGGEARTFIHYADPCRLSVRFQGEDGNFGDSGEEPIP